MLYSVEASKLQGAQFCPNCGGKLELAGKGRRHLSLLRCADFPFVVINEPIELLNVIEGDQTMSWFRETMLKAEAKADQFETWVKDSVTHTTDKARTTVDDTVEKTNEFTSDYQDSTESMLNRIPGYAGYKGKERARDSDRVLRNEIGRQLDQDANRVEAVQRTAADAREVARTTELEPVVQGLRNAANLVRSLSYGYGGLFSDRPIDDAALAQLRLFDEGLLVKATALATGVESIEAGDEGAAAGVTKQIADFKAGLNFAKRRDRSGPPGQTGQATVKISPQPKKLSRMATRSNRKADRASQI